MKRRKVFVFGANTQGRHSAGAALEAREKWGAVYGQARGLQGDSYAIVTKQLIPGKPRVSLFDIAAEVNTFLQFARDNPKMTFLFTPIGTGLAGFSAKDIAPMFCDAPNNIKIPEEFKPWINLEE